MKKKFTFFKTLLVAAGLLGGSSAWAQDWTTVQTLNFDGTNYSDGWGWADSARKGTMSQMSHDTGYAFLVPAGSSYTQDCYYTFTNSDFISASQWKMELDVAFTTANNGTSQFYVYSSASGSSWGCFATTDKMFSLQNAKYSTDVLVYAGNDEATSLATLTATAYSSGGGPNPSIFYHLTITADETNGVMLAIEDASSTSVLAATKVCEFGNPDGMSLRCGKGIGKVAIDDVTFSIVSDDVLVPSAEITAVNGTSRTITMTQSQDADIYYYVCEDDNYDTSDLTPTQYTEPLSISNTTYYVIYATNGSKNSSTVNYSFDAGTNISLASPSVSLASVTNNSSYLVNPSFTINAPNNASVLLKPSTETLTYTFTPEGGSESDPVTVSSGTSYVPTCKGTLTVYAATTGYTTSSYSIPVSNFYSLDKACDYSIYTASDATTYEWTSNEDSKWGTASYSVVTAFSDLNRLRIRNNNTIDYVEGYGFGRQGSTYEYYGRYAVKGNITSFVTYSSISAEPTVFANVLATSGSGEASHVISSTLTASYILKELNYYTPANNPTVSITSAGYASFSSTYPLDLANISGGTAYMVTENAANGYVTLTEATGTVAANTGLIIKGDAGTVTIPVAASGTDYSATNKLVAVTTADEVDAGNYILAANKDGSEAGFYQLEEATSLDAGKAYLPASAVNEARARFLFSDDATAIKSIATDAAENGAIYNVAGQRVNAAYKGIVIKNGKKYLNK